MRSNRLVRASDCQWRSRNSPGFDPSILRHSGIWGAADEAVLNTVHREKNKKIPLFNYVLRNFVPVPLYQGYLGELCRYFTGVLFREDLYQGWINFLQKGFRRVLKERIIRVFLRECNSQRGQRIFTPPPPSHHGSLWLLPVICLHLTNTVSPKRACLSIWLERFRGSQKEDKHEPLSIHFSLLTAVFMSSCLWNL